MRNRRILGGNVWARYWLYFLVGVALFADVLANDRPLLARTEQGWEFPVAKKALADLGVLQSRPGDHVWRASPDDWTIWPPVRFDGDASDLDASAYEPPFAARVTPESGRHWLGTDLVGRDVLSGLIHGTRTSLLVGVGVLVISLLIGIPLGGIAGFFGDSRLIVTRARWWGAIAGIGLGVLYAVICLVPFFGWAGVAGPVMLTLLLCALLTLIFERALLLVSRMQQRVALPVDSLVVLAIEVFVSIPGIVFLVAAAAMVRESSLALVILIIGVLQWTTGARFLRAELLRIRSLPYIASAFTSGIGRWRILFVHALPNAVGPLLVIGGFVMGGAILAEAYLSFLGIGLPDSLVTWGRLLKSAAAQPKAWWLAVFPGLLLTLTVLAAQLAFRK